LVDNKKVFALKADVTSQQSIKVYLWSLVFTMIYLDINFIV
jgi:hypothetical protein